MKAAGAPGVRRHVVHFCGIYRRVVASEPLSPDVDAGAAVVADLEEEVRALLQEQTSRAERITKTLVGFPQLKVVLVSLPARGAWEQHKTSGRIAVQTLAGHIRMRALGQTFDLPRGQMLALESNVPHDVEAVEASVFLLTVARP